MSAPQTTAKSQKIAVRRTEAAPHVPLGAHGRREPPDLVGADLTHLVEPGRPLHGLGRPQNRKLRGGARHEQVPHRPVTRIDAELVGKLSELLAREAATAASVANCARNPPIALPVLPRPARSFRSSTSTSRQPRAARWYATLAPITPAPTTTTSAVRVAPTSPRRSRRVHVEPSVRRDPHPVARTREHGRRGRFKNRGPGRLEPRREPLRAVHRDLTPPAEVDAPVPGSGHRLTGRRGLRLGGRHRQRADDRDARVHEDDVLVGRAVRVERLVPPLEAFHDLCHEVGSGEIEPVEGHADLEDLLAVPHVERPAHRNGPSAARPRRARPSASIRANSRRIPEAPMRAISPTCVWTSS